MKGSVSQGRGLEKEAIPVGVEPTIYCLGGSCVSTAPRNHLPHQGGKSISDSETWGKREKGKAPAGFEPTTFRLLGERTANYAIEPLI